MLGAWLPTFTTEKQNSLKDNFKKPIDKQKNICYSNIIRNNQTKIINGGNKND